MLAVFGVLFFFVYALARFTEWGSRFSILFFLIGVAIGVVIDATNDKTMERNIYPIEAVFWCIIFGPAVAMGREWGERRRRVEK